jgi:processive 1,2-diacylglycerol beta-glucosyltransferase
MPKRILVLSASVGAGHMRAAQAVEMALRQLDPQATVRNVDVLTLATAAFRKLYGQLYLDLVNKAPHVLGYFYDLLDQPTKRGAKGDPFALAIEKLNLRPFLKLIQDEPWDIFVNCHYLPAEIIASLKQEGELRAPSLTVTTDFDTHRLWVNQPCDHYFTATEEGAAYLAHWGIPAKDVTVTGIPIHPVFSQEKDRAACLKRQGLAGEHPVVLQLAGGFGVGPIKLILQNVLSVETPVEVVVVCGKNEKLKKELEKAEVPARHRVRVLGFTDQMDELLAVADVVVSKPGGLTTSEVLARGACMAILNPIPGQESRNSDYLLENGAAIKINNIATLPLKLSQLLKDPARLAWLKANAKKLGHPRAAFDVAQRVLAWPNGRG